MGSSHKITRTPIRQPTSNYGKKFLNVKGAFPTVKEFSRDLTSGMTNAMTPVLHKISYPKWRRYTIMIVLVDHLGVAIQQALPNSLPFSFQISLATSLRQ